MRSSLTDFSFLLFFLCFRFGSPYILHTERLLEQMAAPRLCALLSTYLINTFSYLACLLACIPMHYFRLTRKKENFKKDGNNWKQIQGAGRPALVSKVEASRTLNLKCIYLLAVSIVVCEVY